MIGFAGQREFLVFLIHGNLTAAGNAAFAHAAGHDRCMTGHTAAYSEDTLRTLHACDIFRRSFQADQNDLFTPVGPCFGVFCSKHDFSACSTG